MFGDSEVTSDHTPSVHMGLDDDLSSLRHPRQRARRFLIKSQHLIPLLRKLVLLGNVPGKSSYPTTGPYVTF